MTIDRERREAPPRRSRWPRLVALAVGAVALLLAGGWLFEAAATRVDRQRFPPPGEIVVVAGQPVHLYCAGEGSPTVLVQAGSGDWSLAWRRVQEQVSAMTRICAYDRPGIGWSPAAATPRTGPAIVDEWHTLLTQAGEAGPYVLVGHSLGGLYARLFATEYPAEVLAVVLVDARHEEQSTRQPAAITEQMDAYLGFLSTAGMLAPVGLTRLLGPWFQPAPDTLPVELHPVFRAQVYQRAHIQTGLREWQELPELEERVRAAGTLGDRPLRVVTPAAPADLPEEMREMQRFFEGMQADFLRLSTNSRLIVVPESGHMVHLDQPEVVAGVIEEVVEEVRHAHE